MTHIRPVSDLKNNIGEISTICNEDNQPVFLTKNGRGSLVVMSQFHYDRLRDRIELYHKLGEAEILDAKGEKGTPHKDVMRRLRENLSYE